MEFKDRDIETFWENPKKIIPSRVPPETRKALYRKLQMLDAIYKVSDLKAPPGNRLEQLKGDRTGQWGIRVNKQWRLCFVWENHEAKRVEFNDYHK